MQEPEDGDFGTGWWELGEAVDGRAQAGDAVGFGGDVGWCWEGGVGVFHGVDARDGFGFGHGCGWRS